MSPHPVFDAVIHEPNRLRICALLVPHRAVEFAVLRDETGLSDSALSKHLKTLESVGHITLLKQPARWWQASSDEAVDAKPAGTTSDRMLRSTSMPAPVRWAGAGGGYGRRRGSAAT